MSTTATITKPLKNRKIYKISNYLIDVKYESEEFTNISILICNLDTQKYFKHYLTEWNRIPKEISIEKEKFITLMKRSLLNVNTSQSEEKEKEKENVKMEISEEISENICKLNFIYMNSICIYCIECNLIENNGENNNLFFLLLTDSIEYLTDSVSQSQEYSQKLESHLIKVEDELLESQKSLDLIVCDKKKWENEYLSKFVLILNEKKKKIRELQSMSGNGNEKIEMIERDFPDTPEYSQHAFLESEAEKEKEKLVDKRKRKLIILPVKRKRNIKSGKEEEGKEEKEIVEISDLE